MKKFIKFGLWGMVLWPSLVFGFTMAEKPLKEAPTSSDSFLISDSQDSLKLKQVTTGSLPISTKTQAALDAKQTAIGNPCVAGYFMQGVSSTGVIQCATETDPVFRAWNKSYNDLTNKPALFSGAYSALTGKPELFSGVYSDLSGQPALFSGSYNDLLHKPVLQVLTETDVDNMVSNNGYLTFEADPLFLSWNKSYNDLTNKPTLFSGNYNDLTNKPTTITAGQASAITDNTAKITYPASASTKLAGIATGATANSTDALLRDRTTHTGTQAIATVTGLQAALGLKSDKAAIACATGFVLQGITINGTAECIAASSASLPTGTEGQIISYDINGNPIASTVQDLAFSDTDFNETVSGTTTTISLASAGGGTISLTESATDPAYSSMTTGQMIVSKSSGDLFYKSATGGYTFAGVYVVDPVTYSLGFTLSGVAGADKLTINGTDYTAGTTINGLSGDVAVTGTLGSSTALACTGAGISGSGLSYLASMTAARSMACVFSVASSGVVVTEDFTGTNNESLSSSSWTQTATSDVGIYNNHGVAIPGVTQARAYYNNTTFNDAQYSQVTVYGDIVYSGPMVRCQSGDNGYLATRTGPTTVAIYKVTEGVLSNLSGAITVVSTAGVLLRLEVDGSTLKLYVDNVQAATVTDATFSTGSVGLATFSYSSTAYVDGWEGGDL